jgi:tetratricopeptide (TPR) repeat protein
MGIIARYRRQISDRRRTVGALRRAQTGDYAGAISDLKSLLVDQIRTLDPDCPDTLITRGKLAECFEEAGDKDDAIIEYRYLLASQVRILGPDDLETLDTRKTLARLRGFNRSAIKDHESLLADLIRILGRDHPDTLATLKDLAEHHYYADDGEGAVRDYEQLLAEQVRILGPDDPATLTTRQYLAGSRGFAGDTAGARRDYEGLLADRLRLGQVEIESTSPGGRYVVCVDPFEAGPTQWVDRPELYDTAAARALLALTDRFWHLDSADWQSESVVVMYLRHYSGEYPSCSVTIDCQRLTATVNLSRPGPLGELGEALKHLRRAAREEAAPDKPSAGPAPVAKAAKPVVGLGLAADAKRPGPKKSAPDQAAPATEAAPPAGAPDPS